MYIIATIIREAEARYTLVTKLNSTRSTLLKVYCFQNWQQSRPLPIHSTLLLVLATYRQQREIDSLSQWTLLPNAVNFVATVYGAKATQSKSTVLNSTLSPVCTGLKYPENYGQIRNAARATWFRLQNKQWHNN